MAAIGLMAGSESLRDRLLPGIVLLASFLGFSSGAAAKTPLLESKWRDPGATGEEMSRAATLLEKGRVSVAVSNDDRLLYVTLTTRDRELYSLMFRNGMTLWLDPKGGRRKTLGIRYPLGGDGFSPGGFPGGPPGSGPRGGGPPGGGPRGDVPRDAGPPGGGPDRGEDREAESLVPPARILEILESGVDEPRRVLAGDVPGLDVRIREGEESFTYELTIPLAAAADDHSVGVGAGIGETIGIGWSTDKEKSERPPSEAGGPGGGPGGGMGGDPGSGMGGGPGGGMGGGPGGGMGGGPGGGMGGGPPDGGGHGERFKSADPLRLWIKVQLAPPGTPEARQSAGN